MHGTITDIDRSPPRLPETSLVAAYRESSPFFFASARETLLAHAEHIHAHVEQVSDGTLAQQMQRQLVELQRATGERARVALALPFMATENALGWLLRKTERTHGRGRNDTSASRATMDGLAGFSVSFQPSPRKYVEAVTRALHNIAQGELEKVVMARTLDLSFEERVDCCEWLRRFHAQNAAGYVFAIDLAQAGEPMRKLMGASPELLLEKRGAVVSTNPLAGSRPRGRSGREDDENAVTLLHSEKDQREHALVVDAVAAALSPFCRDLKVPSSPSVISTPTMWHLSTAMSGQLRDADCSSIALAQALHPTPAVAGHPRQRATELICELEAPRGPFAGAIGHCDANGDGEWAVTLRCAEVGEHSARLFAGAGVVAGSDPWAELDETGAKFRTALRALGVPLLGVP